MPTDSNQYEKSGLPTAEPASVVLRPLDPATHDPTSDMTSMFSFRLFETDGAARLGEITTPRGVVRTPAFMPVGTQGAMKGVHWHELRDTGAEIVLGNTYHLMLRPGAERVAALGGLHRFSGWAHPILTDSGGFQVMSLAPLRKVDENGVTFRSHIDGATVQLTPERAVEIQDLLGSDISMQLDECVRLPAERGEIERAMRLSLRWAERSKRAFERAAPGRALFGIVQGGDVAALRAECARMLAIMDFQGYAVGGLAVGEPQNVMLAMIEETLPLLPSDRPHYLMGVGTPDDILAPPSHAASTCSTASCRPATGATVSPSPVAGPSTSRMPATTDDPRPLDEESGCAAANGAARAYLHHLVKANEMLGAMLLSLVNLHYYQDLMQGIRQAIAEGRFADFAAETREGWARGDIPLR